MYNFEKMQAFVYFYNLLFLEAFYFKWYLLFKLQFNIILFKAIQLALFIFNPHLHRKRQVCIGLVKRTSTFCECYSSCTPMMVMEVITKSWKPKVHIHFVQKYNSPYTEISVLTIIDGNVLKPQCIICAAILDN